MFRLNKLDFFLFVMFVVAMPMMKVTKIEAQTPRPKLQMTLSVEAPMTTTTPALRVTDSGGTKVLTLTKGAPFVITMPSVTGEDRCALLSPEFIGWHRDRTTGTYKMAPITPDHPWYPKVGQVTTIKVRCNAGANVVVDSVIVRRQ